jgi:hypothetical protein
MSTSGRDKVRRAYVPNTAAAKSVDFGQDMMHVHLTDGRILSIPLIWFPTLRAATPDQRADCHINAGGRGLHWPQIDEDLSLAGLMAGADPRSS